MNNDLLEQAVVNQLEQDLDNQEYDALSELLSKLIQIEEAKELLVGYLSDTQKEKWLEGKVVIRY